MIINNKCTSSSWCTCTCHCLSPFVQSLLRPSCHCPLPMPFPEIWLWTRTQHALWSRRSRTPLGSSPWNIQVLCKLYKLSALENHLYTVFLNSCATCKKNQWCAYSGQMCCEVDPAPKAAVSMWNEAIWRGRQAARSPTKEGVFYNLLLWWFNSI